MPNKDGFVAFVHFSTLFPGVQNVEWMTYFYEVQKTTSMVISKNLSDSEHMLNLRLWYLESRYQQEEEPLFWGSPEKSSLDASQGQETAREDQGRSGEAQGSESSLPSSSKDGRWPA